MLTLSSAANNVSGTKMPLGEAGVAALLGYVVVFVGLISLMCVIIVVGKIMVARNKKAAAPKAEAAPAPAAAAAPAAPKGPAAPGTAGELKLYDTPDKDAALIMAIVADKMQKPLNELRFISIREVKE